MNLQQLLRSGDFWSILILCATLFGFNLFAAGFVHLPHFWDEAWVYVRALKEMSIHGVSIFPNTISVDLTRGHPLLFHFLGGGWYRVFGLSNEASHWFALVISNLVLITSFLGLRKMIGSWGALFGALFIVVQGIFLAQSGMIFPEMQLTLFVVLAFFAYQRDRTWLFVMAISCALYTKEPAIVYFLAFLLWDMFRVVLLKDSYRLLLKYIIPILVIASHPIILYLNFEWFLFPEHTSLILDNMDDVKWQLRRVFENNFHFQGREWFFFPVMAVMVLMAKIRPFWVRLVLIGVAFSAFKVLFNKWIVPDWLMVVILLIASALPPLLWWRFRTKEPVSNTTHFIAIGYLALVGYVVFSAINFFTVRYLLSSIVLTTVMVTIGLWKVMVPTWTKAVVSAGLLILPLHYTITQRNFGEIDLGLYHDLKVQQGVIDWMVENVPRDSWVCTNFVTANYLQHSHAGYLGEEENYERLHVNYCLTPCETEYVLRTPTVAHCDINQDFEADGYEVVYEDTVGVSMVTLFRKKP